MITNGQGDNDSKTPHESMQPGAGALVSYVKERVKHARETRDAQFADLWKEYTRIWRGFYSTADKTTDSERSRLISPASQQAVEMTASEMEEATFGRKAWIDIEDDIADEDRDDAIAYRDQLLEDFQFACVPEGVTDTFLLGCVYGTGITKINIQVKNEPSFASKGAKVKRFMVTGEAVRPDEFVIDPSATSIDTAMFCAHEVIKPRHSVKSKQASGQYMMGPVTAYSGSQKGSTTGYGDASTVQDKDQGVLITEYYGLVPGILLPNSTELGMVEAIVVLANESTVLKAVASPYTMKDRPIVAYQHDPVPGQFWGRGVVEKGYNPQKALDAELRARIDGLALMTAPMMGADITRMPRNPDLRTRPGKFFMTRGRPSEIIEPVAFQAPGMQATFQNAGDLERMVQMATGAMDSAMPIGQNRRNETSGGMSQMNAAFLKRSKRTMRRVEKYLSDFVTKSLWRYMQFDSQRYPQDAIFKVNSTMGIMAREVENQQLVQMLGFVNDNQQVQNIIIQALFDNTASADKDVLRQAIQVMNAPPTPEEKQQEEMQKALQQRMLKAQVEEQEAKVAKLAAETELAKAKAFHEVIDADLEDDRIEIQAANAATGAEKARQTSRQNDINALKVAVDNKKVDNDKGKRQQ